MGYIPGCGDWVSFKHMPLRGILVCDRQTDGRTATPVSTFNTAVCLHGTAVVRDTEADTSYVSRGWVRILPATE